MWVSYSQELIKSPRNLDLELLYTGESLSNETRLSSQVFNAPEQQ